MLTYKDIRPKNITKLLSFDWSLSVRVHFYAVFWRVTIFLHVFVIRLFRVFIFVCLLCMHLYFFVYMPDSITCTYYCMCMQNVDLLLMHVIETFTLCLSRRMVPCKSSYTTHFVSPCMGKWLCFYFCTITFSVLFPCMSFVGLFEAANSAFSGGTSFLAE